VGRIGLVSVFNRNPPGSVLRCSTVAENGGYDRGGLTSISLRRRPITSSPSQTLRRPLVRTTDDGRRAVSAQRLPPFFAALFFTLRDSYRRTVDNTVDLYAAKPDIRPESRFLPTPPAFRRPR